MLKAVTVGFFPYVVMLVGVPFVHSTANVGGLVGGAGALAAIVPAAAIVLAAATLVGRNVYRDIIRPQAS